jgi:tetratricopeptide (TPR) repeat protein
MAVAPMLGLANYGLHAYADRFTYLPAVGFSILLAVVLSRWASRPAGRLALVLACGVTLLFGFMADRQSRYWRNEQVLFEHTLEVDGRQNHMILGTLGLHYYEFDGDLPKAREYMDAAFAKTISRELASFHFIYIEVLAESGMIDRAWEEAQRVLTMREGEALKQRPEQYDGRVMTDGMRALIYAIISLAEGDLAAVDSHLETVDRLYPGVPHAAYLRGRLALARGDPEEAVRQWRISLDAKRSYMRHRFVEKEIRRLEHGAARP